MFRSRTLPSILSVILSLAAPVSGQTRGAAAKTDGLKTEPAAVTCPSPLGPGVHTGRHFCDVLTGRDPKAGIIVKIPPHAGPATLLFDLHNRYMYSADLERAGRAYTRSTATIGVLTMDNTLISRAVVQNEVRGAADLFDRVSGGAGYNGTKAVAPTGIEPIAIEIPAGIDEVSILGEKLTTIGRDGANTYATEGRPVALISDVRIEYKPAKPARKRPSRRR